MLSELLKSSITDKNSSSVWLLGAPRPARRVPHCLKPYAAWCQPHNCSDQRRWYHSAHPASVSRLQSISHVTARQKMLILPHKTLQLPSSSSLIYHQEERGGLSGCIFWLFHPFFMKQKESTQGTRVENCHSVCSSPAPWPGGNTPCKFSPREAVTVVGNTLEQVSRKAWSWGTALTAFPSHILDKEGPLMGVFWNKIFSFLL